MVPGVRPFFKSSNKHKYDRNPCRTNTVTHPPGLKNCESDRLLFTVNGTRFKRHQHNNRGKLRKAQLYANGLRHKASDNQARSNHACFQSHRSSELFTIPLHQRSGDHFQRSYRTTVHISLASSGVIAGLKQLRQQVSHFLFF